MIQTCEGIQNIISNGTTRFRIQRTAGGARSYNLANLENGAQIVTQRLIETMTTPQTWENEIL